jgi:hypothetical protein
MRSTANADEYYQKLKLSGATGLTIGAESGSNHVLKSINKKSSVEALFFELEKFRENGITCFLLTFTGHWSERPVDFEKQCDMLLKLVPYVRHGTVSGMILGEIFNLLHDTPSWHNDNLIKDPALFSHLWLAKTNLSNTLKVRAQRRLVLHQLAKLLKLPVVDPEKDLQQLSNFIKNKVDSINEFFQLHGTTGAEITDVDTFIHQLFKKNESVNLEIELESYSCNSDPVVTIEFNQQLLHNELLQEGQHKFNFTIPVSNAQNIVSINMTNKNQNQDTLVDSNGNIIKDKFIKIKSIKINNCDLSADQEFFYKNFVSTVDAEVVPTRDGLWSNNETLSFTFQTPFVPWYATTSNKNVSSEWVDIKNSIQVGGSDQQHVYQNLLEVSNQLVI